MDLDELRALVAVVEKGSLVAAARSLRFARATLRRRIDQLEARVGVPLVNRSDSGVTATQAGVMLAERARDLLRDAGELMSSVRTLGVAHHGVLRFVGPIGLPPTVMVMFASVFASWFPSLRVNMNLCEDPFSALTDDVDIATYFGDETPPPRWSAFDIAVGSQLRLMGVASYLDKHGAPTTPAMLSQHVIFSWSRPRHEVTKLELRDGTTQTIAPQIVSPDVYTLRRTASSGIGLALVPNIEPRMPFEDDGLVPVLPDVIGVPLPFRVAVPSALLEASRVRIGLEAIQDLLGLRRSSGPLSKT